ncbi:hypothetical protein Nepgr_028019 [Nepenthes gracilis]|uniref:Uncharacterized protein n=1 Tax=Nepenthes gracilis TaxID=150966 RepID=A0AAD3Y458_NEPGR|nr:hypothetical protein Nepgr_028019 [Nepenthes gracilis]
MHRIADLLVLILQLGQEQNSDLVFPIPALLCLEELHCVFQVFLHATLINILATRQESVSLFQMHHSTSCFLVILDNLIQALPKWLLRSARAGTVHCPFSVDRGLTLSFAS